MGPTGAGKSTFINTVAGKTDATLVGHGLTSCTSALQHVIVPHPTDPGRRIVFVDTPGFNDTNIDDYDILERISAWLAKSYSNRVKVSAVLYLHDITMNRMTGASKKTLNLFQHLCGEKASKGVFFVTTRWGPASSVDEEKREDELKETFFSSMLGHGATCERFLLSHESAWAIVNLVINKGALVEALQIQEELVDLKKRLQETSAGAALYEQLQKICDENVQRLKRSMSEEEIRKLKETNKAISAQLEALKVPLSTKFKRVFEIDAPDTDITQEFQNIDIIPDVRDTDIIIL
ncbi:P-loop containing nucleoside triphosphate hydrolase protein [Hygrophoropsis aurantiaca]|uniref:P-loop containing nucleoside triphosphate hydrolase protein n=1 Tax=Hygrophoropsis aurantiaca TaxID=72124 RepID=A0ACB7ZSK6_9AGAM|nr:P-loop containing nucleoside triphosphate hydrolase protein [Hygrophoropsis aurantiaca]